MSPSENFLKDELVAMMKKRHGGAVVSLGVEVSELDFCF